MKMDISSVLLYLLLLLIGASGLGATLRLTPAPMRVNTIAAAKPTPCLSSHEGYLRARLRRANGENTDTDIDWKDADMECDGGARPEQRGVRLTFAGRLPNSGARVRLVFGIAANPTSQPVRNVPTNVTVIFEDEQKLYSTAGDGKCTIDELAPQSPAVQTIHDREFQARGFCTEPATTINGSDTLLIDRFDFAGIVRDTDTR